MKLILIRHGETEENREGIIQGHLPGKLSPIGILQTQKVAQRLKNEKIDFIYSSDLKRASDTAKEIAKYHPHISIKLTKELRERNYGELVGRKDQEIREEALRENKDMWSFPKGGESFEELLKRTNNFFHKIVVNHPEENIVIISHGGIIKAIIMAIQKVKTIDIKGIKNLENTCVFAYEINENKNYKEILFNCTKHLD